jgi:hypothetical protein
MQHHRPRAVRRLRGDVLPGDAVSGGALAPGPRDAQGHRPGAVIGRRPGRRHGGRRDTSAGARPPGRLRGDDRPGNVVSGEGLSPGPRCPQDHRPAQCDVSAETVFRATSSPSMASPRGRHVCATPSTREVIAWRRARRREHCRHGDCPAPQADRDVSAETIFPAKSSHSTALREYASGRNLAVDSTLPGPARTVLESSDAPNHTPVRRVPLTRATWSAGARPGVRGLVRAEVGLAASTLPTSPLVPTVGSRSSPRAGVQLGSRSKRARDGVQSTGCRAQAWRGHHR